MSGVRRKREEEDTLRTDNIKDRERVRLPRHRIDVGAARQVGHFLHAECFEQSSQSVWPLGHCRTGENCVQKHTGHSISWRNNSSSLSLCFCILPSTLFMGTRNTVPVQKCVCDLTITDWKSFVFSSGLCSVHSNKLYILQVRQPAVRLKQFFTMGAASKH
jgi:hypothetical protein